MKILILVSLAICWATSSHALNFRNVVTFNPIFDDRAFDYGPEAFHNKIKDSNATLSLVTITDFLPNNIHEAIFGHVNSPFGIAQINEAAKRTVKLYATWELEGAIHTYQTDKVPGLSFGTFSGSPTVWLGAHFETSTPSTSTQNISFSISYGGMSDVWATGPNGEDLLYTSGSHTSLSSTKVADSMTTLPSLAFCILLVASIARKKSFPRS